MNLTWFMAWCKINGALNHVGFRASHAPYMVHGGEKGMCSLATPCTPRGAGLRSLRLPPVAELSPAKHSGEVLIPFHRDVTSPSVVHGMPCTLS